MKNLSILYSFIFLLTISYQNKLSATSFIANENYLIAVTETSLPVFSPHYYLNFHNDLKSAKVDPTRHWLQHGKYEGRASSPVFDVKYYLDSYPDLQRAFGNDYGKAIQHFINHGMKEGRKSSPFFDVKYYIENHKDIKSVFGVNYYEAMMHFLKIGIMQGRQGAPGKTVDPSHAYYFKAEKTDLPVFFGNYYLNNYQDLRNARVDPLKHWLNHGIREGRSASPIFDVKFYLNKYADLKRAFGNDYSKALQHFLDHGINEKRQGSEYFDVNYYMSTYERDIMEFYGKHDVIGVMNHFIIYGIKEGKEGVPDKKVLRKLVE